MDLVHAGGYRDALGFFSGAIEIDRAAKRGGLVEPRYLSYYGLCLGLARANKHEALENCRAAIRREPYDPDFWGNLGRVALIVGRRGEAYEAFRRGLKVEPGHRTILQNLKRMGVRRPPVLTFLSRGNPINVSLGRARSRWERRRRTGHAATRSALTEPANRRDEATL
jgi:tetratricopeptide (TPR) repeat protein